MPELTAARLKEISGHQALKARLQFRVSEAFEERVDRCAEDCGLPTAEWLRSVVEMAVDAHEQREKMILAGLDPDALVADELDEDDDEVLPEPPTLDPEYMARVRAGAEEIRDAEAGPPPPPPAPVNQRDCPHLLTHRRGSVCGNCGAVLGGSRMMPSATGRYVGRR